MELSTEENQTEGLYVETAYLNTTEGTYKSIWKIIIGIEEKHVFSCAEVNVLSEVT